MYVKYISLRNFRNYENLELEFNRNYNIFYGENGSGKTNILESISIVSSVKSFRGASDEEMVKSGENYYFCKAGICNSDSQILEVGYSKDGVKRKKKLKINGREINKFSEYFGVLITSTISPDDVNIVKGSPEIKRKYFDLCLVKLYKEYAETLINFRRSLVNRTAILKKIKEGRSSEKRHLDVWNDIFADESAKLIVSRKTFIFELNKIFSDVYKKISGMDFSPKILYKNSMDVENKDDIVKKLEQNYNKEVAIGITLHGPQRDNYVFVDVDGKDCIPYFSYGQKRMVAISLKCSELIFMENTQCKKPVVLVDDVFAELDEKRKKSIFDFFKSGYQVFFTAVNLNMISNEDIDDANIYYVEKGSVKRV